MDRNVELHWQPLGVAPDLGVWSIGRTEILYSTSGDCLLGALFYAFVLGRVEQVSWRKPLSV
jgi:hypothetical protein